VIQKLWFWGEELHITPDELNNNLFPAVNKDRNNAIYRPACIGSKELLDDLLGASKETQLNTKDVRKLLVVCRLEQCSSTRLSRDIGNDMAEGWRSAAKSTWVKDVLLLYQYKEGQIAWYVALFGNYIGLF
jgi:hypothetical protein